MDYKLSMTGIFNLYLMPGCASCHSGASAAVGLVLNNLTIPPAFNTSFDRTAPEPATTWWCLVRDASQSCVPDDKKISTSAGSGFTFRRPQLTKYVRALNHAGACSTGKQRINELTTNWMLMTSTDIDFGANHPTSITANELGLLSR